MNTIKPKISILITNFNYGEYLEETIFSAMNQTYKNIEVIVSDNNSTDDSWKLLQKSKKKFKNLKISKNRTNIGAAANWNKAISLAKGEYILLLSADDVLLKNTITTLYSTLKKYKADMVFGNEYSWIEKQNTQNYMQNFKEDELIFTSKQLLLTFIKNLKMAMPGTYLIKNVFKNEDVWMNEKYKFHYDMMWLFRFLLEPRKIIYLNTPVIKFRIHDKNIGLNRNKDFKKEQRILREVLQTIDEFNKNVKLKNANKRLSKIYKRIVRSRILFSYWFIYFITMRNKVYKKYFKNILSKHIKFIDYIYFIFDFPKYMYNAVSYHLKRI